MNTETAALLLCLALAQIRCPNREHFLSIHPEGPGWKCSTCKGSVKVPLFPDTVRVECRICKKTGIIGYACTRCSNWPTNDQPCFVCGAPVVAVECEQCHGRGWVPSTDPMAWAKHIYIVLTDRVFISWPEWSLDAIDAWQDYRQKLLEGDFEAALPHAVKALELAGILEVNDETT